MADDKIRMSEHKPSSNWWSNALRSIGSSSLNLITDMMPYTKNTVSTVGEAAKSVRDNIRKATTSGKSGIRAFENSALIKSAREGLRNAKEDLKSGNFNNEDRQATSGPMAELSAEMNETFDDVSFDSFGDEDGGDNYNTAITNNYGGDNAYLADSIAEGFKKSTNASIAAGTAQVNALVASTSNAMMANQKFFSEVTGKLDSVDKNLEAIVTYLNQNVTKYIEASAAYYGQQSSDGASGNGEAPTDASTVFGGSGFNLAEYKKLVTEQFNNTEIGQMASMGKMFIQNGGIGEFVRNPFGLLISTFGDKLLSPSIKKAFKDFDTGISRALPAIAERIAEYGEENDGPLGTIARILGVKTKTDGKFTRRHFENKTVPWDAESKNALVRTIPGYLAKILQAVRGDDEVERWDNTTMSLRKESDIKRSMVKENQDAIAGAFADTDIGKSLSAYATSIGEQNKALGEQFSKAVQVFYEQSASQAKSIKRGDLADSRAFVDRMFEGSGVDLKNIPSEFIDLIVSQVEKAYNAGGDGGLDHGRRQARLANNAKLRELDKNENRLYNEDVLQQFHDQSLFDITKKMSADDVNSNANAAIAKSHAEFAKADEDKKRAKVFQTIDDIRFLLDRGINVHIIKGGKPFASRFGGSGSGDDDSKKPTKPTDSKDVNADENKSVADVVATAKDTVEGTGDAQLKEYDNPVENTLRKGVAKGSSFIHDLIYGGPEAAGRSIEESIKSGLKKAGDFANEHILNPIANVLLGEKDENGKRNGGVFHTISSSISDYLLGPKKDGEDNREGGFLTRVKSTFNNGIDGWAKTLFGDDVKEGETPEQAAERRRKQLKGTAAKGAVGLGAGMIGAGMLQGSLLGAAINPALGGLIGLGGVIAAHSKSFKEMLFGKDELDEKGNKTGKHIKGIVSLRTQEFFKKNGKMILGGAALGTLKSFLIPSSGGLLSGIVGGPVAGMLIGAGMGMVKQTSWFKNLMFGQDIKDGNGNVTGHVDGLKDKVKKLFSKNGGKNGTGGGGYKLGMTLLSSLGGAGIGGILGVAAGPLIGGLLGAGAGILANSEKFKTALFGGKDENGKRHGGVFGKISTKFDAYIIAPMKAGFKDIKDRFAFHAKKIGGMMMIAMQPLKDAFDNFKENIHQSVSRMFRRIEAGINNVLIKPLKGVAKFITAPVRMLGKGIANAGRKAIDAIGNGITKIGGKLITSLVKHTKKSAMMRHVRALRAEIGGFVKAGIHEMFRPITDSIHKVKNKIGEKLFGKNGLGGTLTRLINDKFGKSFESIGDMLKTGFRKIVMAPFKLIGKLISAPFKLVGGAFKAIGKTTRAVTGTVGMLASMGNTNRIDANKAKLSNAEKAKEYYQLKGMAPSEMTHEQQARLQELQGEVDNKKLNLGGMKDAASAQEKINRYQTNIREYQASLMVDDDGNPLTRYQDYLNKRDNMTIGQRFNAWFRAGKNEYDQYGNVTRNFYDPNASREYDRFKTLLSQREQGALSEQGAAALAQYEKKFGAGEKGLAAAEKKAKTPIATTHSVEEELAHYNKTMDAEKLKLDQDRVNARMDVKRRQRLEKLSGGNPEKYKRLLRENGLESKDDYDHSMDPDVLEKQHARDNDALNSILSGYTDSMAETMDKNLDGAAEFFNKGLTPGSIYTNDVHSVGILQQIYKFLVGAFTGETVTDRDLDQIANPQKYTTATRLGDKYTEAMSTAEGSKAVIRDWAVAKYGEEDADTVVDLNSLSEEDMAAVKEHYMKTHEAEAAKELADEAAADKKAAKSAIPIPRAQLQFAGMPGLAMANAVGPVIMAPEEETAEDSGESQESSIDEENASIASSSKRKKKKGPGRRKKKAIKKRAEKEAASSEEDSAQMITIDPESVAALSSETARKNDIENDNNAQVAAEQEKEKADAEARQNIINGSNEALEKKLEREKEEEKNATLTRIADNSENTANSVKHHSSLWSSIFSKKGLITAGIIALTPLLFNLLNGGLFSKIKDLIGDLGSLVSNVVSHFWDAFNSNGGVLGMLKNVLQLGERGMKLLKGDVIGAITNDEGDVDNVGASTLRAGTRSIVKSVGTNSSAFLKGAQHAIASGEAVDATKDFVSTLSESQHKGLMEQLGKNYKGGKVLDYGDVADTLTKAASGSDEAVAVLKKAGLESMSDATENAAKAVTKATGIAETAAKYGDDIVKDAAKGTAKLTKGKGGIIQKLVDWTKEAIARLNKWLGEKFGKVFGKCKFAKKLVETATDSFLTKAITESFPRFGKVLAKMGISTGTAFISELIFVGLGALDGTERTAYMFDCSKSDVDYIMTNISTVFSALLATSVGGVFDIVNSLIEGICGWNPVKCIAQELYKLLADDEMEAELKKSQEEFKQNWKSEAYKRYSENDTDAGNKMSEEDFMAQSEADIANKSGYTFNEYNNHVNAGLTDQAVKGVVDFGKRTGERFSNRWSDVHDFRTGAGAVVGTLADVNNTIYDGIDTVGHGASKLLSTAGTAVQAGTTGILAGVGGLFGDNGKAAGELMGSALGGVGASALEAGGMAVEAITGTAKGIAEFASIGVSGLGDMIAGKKSWDDVMSDYSQFWSDTADGMSSWWNQHTENFSNIWNKVTDGFSSWWHEITKSQEERAKEEQEKAEAEAQAAIKAEEDLFNAQSDAVATIAESYGSDLKQRLLTKRNVKITTMASGGVVTSGEPILSMLSPGEIVVNPADKNTQAKQELAEREKASSIIHSNALTNDGITPISDVLSTQNDSGAIGLAILSVLMKRDAMGSTTSQLRNIVSNYISEEDAKRKQTESSGEDTVEFKSKYSNVTNVVSPEEGRTLRIIEAIKDLGGLLRNQKSTAGTGKSYGRGKTTGSETAGVTLYQQEDPRWSSNKYKTLDMHDSGCGPTAAAIAASAYGSKMSPVDAAEVVNTTGNRMSDGGTTPQGIELAGASAGVSMNEDVPNEQHVVSNLLSGKPVIMMGEDSEGTSSGSSVYGDGMHYVVATGYNSTTGDVKIADPLKPAPEKRKLGDVMNNTVSTIYTGGNKASHRGGAGRKQRIGGRGPFYKDQDAIRNPTENDNAIAFVDTAHLINNDVLGGNITIGEAIRGSLASVYGYPSITDEFTSWLTASGDSGYTGSYTKEAINAFSGLMSKKTLYDIADAFTKTDKTSSDFQSNVIYANAAYDAFMDETQEDQMAFPARIAAANLWRYYKMTGKLAPDGTPPAEFYNNIDRFVSNSYRERTPYEPGAQLSLVNEIPYDSTKMWQPYVPKPYTTIFSRNGYNDNPSFFNILNQNKVYVSDSFLSGLGDDQSAIDPVDLQYMVELGLEMDTKYDKGIATKYAELSADDPDAAFKYLDKFVHDALVNVDSKLGAWKCGSTGVIPDPSSQLFTTTVEQDVEDYGTVSVPLIAVFPIIFASRGLVEPADKNDPLIKNIMTGDGFKAFASIWNSDHFGDRLSNAMPAEMSVVGSMKRMYNSEPLLSYWPRMVTYFAAIDAFIKKYIIVSDDEIDKVIKSKLASTIRKALNEIQITDAENATANTTASTCPFTLASCNTGIVSILTVLFRGKSVDGFAYDNDVKGADLTLRCLMFENQDKTLGTVINKWLKRAYELTVINENAEKINASKESLTKFKSFGNLYQLEVARAIAGVIGTLSYVEPTDKDAKNVPAGKSSMVGAILWAYSSVLPKLASISPSVAALYDSKIGGKITGLSPVSKTDAEDITKYLYAGDVLFYSKDDMASKVPNFAALYIGDGYMVAQYSGAKGPAVHKVAYNLGSHYNLVGVKRFIKNDDNDCHEMEYDLESGKYVIDGSFEAETTTNALSTMLGLFGELANRIVQGVFTGKWDTDMTSYMNGGTQISSSSESLLGDSTSIANEYGDDNTSIIGDSSHEVSSDALTQSTAISSDDETAEETAAGTGRHIMNFGRGRKLARRPKSYGRGRGSRKYGRGNQYIKAGETVKLPKGAGWYRTIMHWDSINRDLNTNQAALINNAGEKYDNKGYGMVDDRYVVATTETFGEAGDYIDIKQSDGTTVPAIIGDIKAWGNPNEPVTKWGHTGGENVIEFIDKRGTHSDIPDFTDHKEWYGVTVDEITNRGTSKYVGGTGLVNRSGVYSDMSYDKTGHDKTPGSSLISYKVEGGHTKFDGALPIVGSYEASVYNGSEAGDYGGSTELSSNQTSSAAYSSQSSSNTVSDSSSNGFSNVLSEITNNAGASGLSELSNVFSQLGNDISAAVLGDSSGSHSSNGSSSSTGSTTIGSSKISTSASYSDKGVQSKPSAQSSFKPTSAVDSSSDTTADGWFAGGEGISGGSWRNSYYSGHAGLDYPAAEGSSIYTPVSGTVVKQVDGPDVTAAYHASHTDTTKHWTGFGMDKYITNGGFGNYTVVQDDKTGLCHIFAHQSVPSSIAVGTHVNRGDRIGSVGTTGMSTGAHLHYQISPPNEYGGVNTDKFMDPNEFDYSQFVSGRGNTPSSKWKNAVKPEEYKFNSSAIGGGMDDGSSNKIVQLLETLVDSIETIVTNTGNSVTGLDKVKKAMESIKIENSTTNNVIASGGTKTETTTQNSSTGRSSSETYARRIARGH